MIPRRRSLRSGAWCLVVALTACAGATSAADSDLTSTGSDAQPERSSVVDEVTSSDELENEDPSSPPRDDSDEPVSTSAPSTSTPTSTSTPSTTPEPITTGSDSTDVADTESEGSDPLVDEPESFDEPSFELGPDVVLDVDLARFPPDDAGQGGAGDASSPTSIAPAATGWAAVDAHLEDALLRSGNTAAGVAVLIDGDVVHEAAFGTRDPATGDPAEPADRFRIASISKPITAIVAMRLVESGVVELDTPIGGLVADHVGLDQTPGSAESLTLRQLLGHRSGFGKYQSTFFRSGAVDCADAARQGLASGATGGGYTYSNMNYCVAGLAIEALTGLSYEDAVYRELLTPLGISGMRLPPTVDPGPGEVQHATAPGRNYMETLGAAGAWIASPRELVTIFDSLDLSTSGYKPVTLDGARSLVTPQGGTLGQRGYGLGVISYGGGRFGHTGTIESTHAMLLNRGDGVTWAITVAGPSPSESTSLERIMNDAFVAGGFVAG